MIAPDREPDTTMLEEQIERDLLALVPDEARTAAEAVLLLLLELHAERRAGCPVEAAL